MASILILGVKIPFTKGGQEVLVGNLSAQLKARGHEVDVIELPFSVLPKEGLPNQAAMWRTLDLSNCGAKQADLVICTKFPSYFVRHPLKSLWLVHQHRAIYDLFGSRFSDFSDDPRDEAMRRLLVEGDRKAIGECAYVSGISANVVKRLETYNDLRGDVLYPPLPLGGRYSCAAADDYVLSVGRLCTIKRVDMMIKAMPIVHNHVKLKVVGTPDEPGVMDYFRSEIDKHHLWDRVQFEGRVDDERLLELYSGALAVYYAPHNEDYGYVTLEAMASSKPVITATDSGGVIDFVEHEKHGLVVEPTSDAIGHATNRLVADKELAARMGLEGRRFVDESGLARGGWDLVVEKLLSPLAARTEAACG